MDIWFYRRGSNELEKEVILGEKELKLAYAQKKMPPGCALLFRYGFWSTIYGWYLNSFISRKKILPTIKKLGINKSEFLHPVETFPSFNDFFIRKLRQECRPFDPDASCLVSPAEGRTLIYPNLLNNQVIPIKGSTYTVDQVLQRDASDFAHGALVVIRLSPGDYHRFHFPCDGMIRESRYIQGTYHSVNPIALATGINIFSENKRECTIITNPIFGIIAMVEVGAFGVGSIVQTYQENQVTKMVEKGYFQFGGSTILLFLQKNKITFSEDIVRNSAKGYETLIKVGETIGRLPAVNC